MAKTTESLGVKWPVPYHQDAERATGVAKQLLSGSRERKPGEMSKVQKVKPRYDFNYGEFAIIKRFIPSQNALCIGLTPFMRIQLSTNAAIPCKCP
jgi:hypothetical protein